MIFFKIFKKYPDIIQGILEKRDGPVNLFSEPKSKSNVLKALKELGYKAKIQDLIFAEQTHGKNIYFCPPDINGYLKFNVDGLITETPGQILIIRTADCIPLLLYEPLQKRIGVVHVGRRGLAKGIVERAIKIIGGKTENLKLGFGPHIRKCCYSFDKEFYLKQKKWRPYFQERNEKFYLDLTKILMDKLGQLGLKKSNIEDCQICNTCQTERFYSARSRRAREKPSCFATFIGLKKPGKGESN